MLTAARFVQSSRKNNILVDENNFHYKKKRGPINNRTSWECRQKDLKLCKARATTVLQDGQEFIEKIKGEHIHSSDLLKKRVDEIQNAVIENAVENPTIPCRAVLADLTNTLHADSLEAATSMNKLATLKMKIYRARKSALKEDKLPSTADDLMNLPDDYTKLDSGENFLVSAANLSEEDDVALIFMSDFGKRILESSEDWFMDGTFATVPEQFCQLYVIMGSQRGKLFPASFMLLPNKQGATYGHALDVIKEQVATLQKM